MDHETECPTDPCCCEVIVVVRNKVIAVYQETWDINLTRIGEGNYAKGYTDALEGLMPRRPLSSRKWVL